MLLRWSEFLQQQGVGDHKIWQDMRAVFLEYRGGVCSYELAARRIPELYCRSLAGLKPDATTSMASLFQMRDCTSLFPFVRPLCVALSSCGVEIVIVSGAPQVVLDAYKVDLPIGRCWGVAGEVLHGRYTGEVEENAAGSSRKEEIARLEGAGGVVVLAIGDAEPDLPLLRCARRRIVVDSDVLWSPDASTFVLRSATAAAGEVVAFVERL